MISNLASLLILCLVCAVLGVFVSPEGALRGPEGIAFQPDGSLLVVSHWSNNVLRFDR